MRFLQNDCQFDVVDLSEKLISISGGATPSGADYPDFGVPFLRVQNIMPGYLDMNNLVYISQEVHDSELYRSQLKSGDVLLTITGVSYGKSAYVPNDLGDANINQHSVRMSFTGELLSEYVSTFLNCRFGKLQSDMKITGVTRPALDYEEIKSIKIPLIPKQYQLEIRALLRESESQRHLAITYYAEAEGLLLAALGLDGLDLSPQLSYTAMFDEVETAERFDSEYYQPKYYRIIDAIRQSGFPVRGLGQIVEPIRNGFDYRAYEEEGTPYIRVGDVRNGRIDIAGAVKIPIKIEAVSKDIELEVHDVLFTRKGTFGQAAVVREGQEHCIISSEIMLLRTRNNPNLPVLPDYLSLFLNSDLGFQQVERRVHGVAYYSISQPDLATVQIAIPPVPIQQEIADKIYASLEAENRAKQLLETAKQRVEQMILGE